MREIRAMFSDQILEALKKEVFEYLLKREIDKVIRYPRSLSLALIMPESVNGRNDEERRADLKAIESFLQVSVRNSDILGWQKDGVFAWIMVETDERGAQVAGERLRKIVEGAWFGRKRQTISMGIATFPTHSLNLPDILRRAENRLIRAKAQGGNRLCITDE